MVKMQLPCQSDLRIAILATKNPYNSTRYFAKGLYDALKKIGVKVDLYTFAPDCFYKAFYAMQAEPPDLTLSFSDIRMGSLSLGELSHTPHLSCLIDPAIYFRHQFQGNYSLVSTTDRKELAYIKSSGFSKAFFLPHAVDGKLLIEKSGDRIYDLVALGTCYDYEKIASEWSSKYSLKIERLLLDAAEEVLSSKGISCLEALKNRGVEEELGALHGELDLYVEGKERVVLLRSLKKLSLHIWGRGPWKKYLPEANLHPPVAFQKVPALLRQAKIVLNAAPRFKDGSHERIFYGLACGALPLTGSNPYLRENFTDGEDILLYSHGEYEGVEERVRHFISNTKERNHLVDQGKKKVASSHTWENRAQVLVSYLTL